MESVELLLVTGKKIGWYLLITYVRRIAHNNVEAAYVGGQKINLTDISFKRERKAKCSNTAAAGCNLCLVNIVGEHIAL